MRQRDSGAIVNITSVAGRVAALAQSPYVASKWALEGLSEGLAQEVAPFGIRVAIIEPGVTRSAIFPKNVDAPSTTGAYADHYTRMFQFYAAGIMQATDPFQVAEVIHHASTTDTPRLRYACSWGAKEIVAGRQGMSDEDWVSLGAAHDAATTTTDSNSSSASTSARPTADGPLRGRGPVRPRRRDRLEGSEWVTGMAGAAIVGRDREVDSIEAFVSKVERGPCALVLAGEAGIGKTILWQAGVEAAERRCSCLLTFRGVEAEALLSFSGLSELLGPVLETVTPSLVAPRRHALEAALLLAEPSELVPDAHAIGLAVLDVLRILAEQGPVVVALDDVQWLDLASAGALQIALRRLHAEPVGFFVTVRDAPGLSVPVELERCFDAERLQRLTLGPLSLGELRRLLSDRLALDLARPVLVRLQAATSGNPFFALELGRELVRTNTQPTAGQPFRVPESLQELLAGRLARLTTDTGDVLLHVAALARPTVELVSAAHEDGEGVLDALDAAVSEGVIKLDDSRVCFTHPLHASVCYQRAPTWKRRAVHRTLARVVTDVEERARHLARAAEGPDAAVATELQAAADSAVVRGATAAGAELYELAAGLTPGDPALARKRRMSAATLHRLAGDRERATATLERLRAEAPHGVERADILFELAVTRRVDSVAMIGFCDEALAEPSGDDVRSARILAYRSFSHMFAGDVPRALLDARAALETAERVGEPTLVAVAIARIGQAETYAAEATPGLLERGAEIEDRLGLALEYYESPRVALARLQMRLGQVERARSNLEELIARAVARGDEGTRGQLLWSLSIVDWLAGRWQMALAHAVEAHELMEQTQETNARGMMGRVKALIETDLGLVDQARASAQGGLGAAQAMSDEYFAISSIAVLGRLELALGNVDAAGDYLRDLPQRLSSLGINDPAAPMWADAIETLTALGELERATAYLERHEANAHRLGSPPARSAVARCRGLLLAREGDLTGAMAAVERAVAELEAYAYPFERGRALLALGSVRRQAQRKGPARAVLEQALAIFEDLGARLWADKARNELARISGRPPAAVQLTETERQVAALAAQGRSNNAIAAELHMGLSTVEAHLSRVYRKLNVRRAQLATRLASLDSATNRVENAPQI